MLLLRVAHDDKGAVLVEATIMMIIIFVFVLGSIDFLLAFYPMERGNESRSAWGENSGSSRSRGIRA